MIVEISTQYTVDQVLSLGALSRPSMVLALRPWVVTMLQTNRCVCCWPPRGRRYAWGDDEVDVLNRGPLPWFKLGLTVVDSLDTLLLMGLSEEFNEARHFVANHLRWPGNHVQVCRV